MGRGKKGEKKIAELNNEYTKEQYSDFQKQQKQLVFKRRRLTIVFGFTFVIFVVTGIQLLQDYHRLNEFKSQLVQEKGVAKELDQKLGKLENEVALLNDEEYVAKLARYRFDMSKEEETIYRIPALDKIIQK